MSSTLRLSIMMALLLATAALGLVAYNNMNPKPVVHVTEYMLVPRLPLAGTLSRHVRCRQVQRPATKISAPSRWIVFHRGCSCGTPHQ